MRETHRMKEDFFILQSEGGQKFRQCPGKNKGNGIRKMPRHTPEQSLNTTSGPVSPYQDMSPTDFTLIRLRKNKNPAICAIYNSAC